MGSIYHHNVNNSILLRLIHIILSNQSYCSEHSNSTFELSIEHREIGVIDRQSLCGAKSCLKISLAWVWSSDFDVERGNLKPNVCVVYWNFQFRSWISVDIIIESKNWRWTKLRSCGCLMWNFGFKLMPIWKVDFSIL